MKKLMILVGAFAAFVAFALPASASANWKMEGEPIAADATIEITASDIAFTGGVTCESANAMATLHAGTNDASIESLEVANCEPTETLAALGCEAVHVEVESLPWTATDEPLNGRVRIEGIQMTKHYTGGVFCPDVIAVSDDPKGGVYLTPEDPNAIDKGTLSGTVETGLGTQNVYGGGAVDPAGTYGL